ncbi:MAG: flagellar assembly protein FliH [Rhodocyclales bacterium]|nr:flagellar assembly protein FliH [Rhodocyclales bacterium]
MSVARHQAVGAYQRWTPTAFDEEVVAASAKVDPPADKATSATPEPPSIKLPTAQDIEAMFEQARAEGMEAGRAEGLAAARAEATRLASLVSTMDAALDSVDDAVAEEIIALAIAVARRMVGQTLIDTPASIVDTVKEVLQQTSHNEVRLHLHPDDAALVREHLATPLEQGHHRIVEDPAIQRGGCRAEATGSQIDATLETRWRRILEGMGRTSTWDQADA